MRTLFIADLAAKNVRHCIDKYNPRLVRVRSTTVRKHQLTAPRVEWTVQLTQIVSNTVFFLKMQKN